MNDDAGTGRSAEASHHRRSVRPVPEVPDPAGIPASGVGNWNLANALTGLRLLLVPVFAALLSVDSGQRPGWRVAAWGAFALAAMTDRLDGQVARSRGLVTDFGKLADPIADKALTGTAMVGLSLLGELSWVVTAVVLVREIGVTLLRFAVLRSGVLPASRGGKLKTLLLNIAIGLYVLPLDGWMHDASAVLMAAAVIVSTVTGIDYVGRAMRMRRAHQAGVETAGAAAPGTPLLAPREAVGDTRAG